ncbi:MAG: hypothetical protein WC919_05540 [Candidatus Paceibacterota bacterium]|jgi:hypothetical protein
MPKSWNNIPGDSSYNVYLDGGVLYLENDNEVPGIVQRELFPVLRHVVGRRFRANQLLISLSVDWLTSGTYYEGSHDTPDLDSEFRLAGPVEYNIEYGDKRHRGRLSTEASQALFQLVEQDIIDKNPADKYIYHDSFGESHFERSLNRALLS